MKKVPDGQVLDGQVLATHHQEPHTRGIVAKQSPYGGELGI